jgi:type VI secretion system protein
MRLVLTLAEGGASLPEKDRKRTLSSSGAPATLSIGRGFDNDWTLPSPDKNLSRTHCIIAFENGHYVLTDRSTNGVHINQAQTATERDSRVVLNEGDAIAMGGYLVTVALIDDPSIPDLGRDAVRNPNRGFGAAGGEGQRPPEPSPLADPLLRPALSPSSIPEVRMVTGRRGVDPLETSHRATAGSNSAEDDRFSGMPPSADWHGLPKPDHAPATAQAVVPPRVITPRKINFDDIIGELPGAASGAPATSREPKAELPRTSNLPLAEDARSVSPPENQSLNPILSGGVGAPPSGFVADLTLPLRRGRDPGHRHDAGPPPVAFVPNTAPIEESGDDRGHDGVVEHGPPAFAQYVTPPELTPPDPSTRANMEHPPTAPARNVGPADQSGRHSVLDQNARAALAAFLEGAGVPEDRIESADPEATLRAAGEIFRAMVEGFQRVLKSRAAVKSDMGIEHTIISGTGNNALKFSVTAADAVRLLLSPGTPGYMEPLAAAREASADIESHELAVMAGMQQALLTLLRRFDPDVLEQRQIVGKLDGLLPAARKARYWDAFRQTYAVLSREAEDEFQSVFGRPFAKAYNEQTRKG